MAPGSRATQVHRSSLDIIVIGGSLSGLMYGVMLKRLGHRVRILEQQVGSPKSQMAGIALGAQVKDFLERFDGLDQSFALKSECLQYIDSQSRAKTFFVTPRSMTSWDAFFYRLRANFDGLRSSYYPEPPQSDVEDGTAVYHSGKQVTDLLLHDGKVAVEFDDLDTGESGKADADLVLGADGPSSVVRHKFLSASAVQRSYSGYVVWRGVIPEMDVSEETRKCFQENITYLLLQGEHAIVYLIPGKNGSLRPGERLLNFAWYSNHSPIALTDIMTDKDGHEHNATVSIRDDVWKKQCLHGDEVFTAPYREVTSKIAHPFVQKITDYSSPRAAFLDGKVLLVGDALTLFRPHIAFSTNQAAFDCLQTERYLNGEIELSAWEAEVLHFGHLHWLRSVWWGESYQRGRFYSVPAALWYWLAVARHMFYGRWIGPQ